MFREEGVYSVYSVYRVYSVYSMYSVYRGKSVCRGGRYIVCIVCYSLYSM